MELLLHVPGSKSAPLPDMLATHLHWARLRLQECAEEAKVTMRQFASRKVTLKGS